MNNLKQIQIVRKQYTLLAENVLHILKDECIIKLFI